MQLHLTTVWQERDGWGNKDTVGMITESQVMREARVLAMVMAEFQLLFDARAKKASFWAIANVMCAATPDSICIAVATRCSSKWSVQAAGSHIARIAAFATTGQEVCMLASVVCLWI